MTPALLPVRCPTWTPRLPSLTVDVRTYLSGVVSSPNSTREARYSAAADLSVIAKGAHCDHWHAMACMFDDIFDGAA